MFLALNCTENLSRGRTRLGWSGPPSALLSGRLTLPVFDDRASSDYGCGVGMNWPARVASLSRRLARPDSALAPGALFVLVVLACSPWLGAGLQNGDSAAYNEQVQHFALSRHTTHFGYLLLGLLTRPALWSGVGIDTAMNWMTLIVGALGACGVFVAARAYASSAAAGLFALLSVLAIPAYLEGMLLSEVDVPLAAFTALSAAAWATQRFALAGALYGFAMLISPLAAWTLPVFVLAFPLEGEWRSALRRQAMSLTIFGAVALLVWAPVVAFHSQNYFYSGRGIFGAPRESFDVARHLRHSWRFAETLLPLLPLYAGGLAIALKRPWGRAGEFAPGLLVSVVAIALLGERFGDVPVQLPTAVLMSIGAGGLIYSMGQRIGRATAVAVALMCLTLTSVPGLAPLRQQLADLDSERQLYLEMKRASGVLPPVLVGVSSEWSEAWRFNWIVHGRARADRAYTSERFASIVDEYATSETDYVFWFLVAQKRSDLDPLTPRYKRKRILLGEKRFNTLWPRGVDPAVPGA